MKFPCLTIGNKATLWQQALRGLVRCRCGGPVAGAALPCACPPAPAGGALGSAFIHLKMHRKYKFPHSCEHYTLSSFIR